MLLNLLLVFFVIYLLLKFPHVRLLVTHPLQDINYFICDLEDFIREKRYNLCPTGEMVCFSGLFGRGKTLSAVHRVRTLCNRYDGRKVWDNNLKCFVTQRVHVISNVTFTSVSGIRSFEPLESLSQIVEQASANIDIDKANKTRTVLLVLIDEASVQLNSRGFKNNFNADFLNTLLTSRHYHMSFYYTSQRFGLTDKLLRDVTQTVYDCSKVWRLQGQNVFDAWELENAGNPEEVRPRRKTGFFVRDVDYYSYDTLAVVSTLSKAFAAGDIETDQEKLLARRAPKNTPRERETEKPGIMSRLMY